MRGTKSGKLFCSKICESTRKTSLRNEKIKNNEFVSSRTLKKYLIGTYGEHCTKCGWSEKNIFSNKTPLEINHKDGNSDNNKIENVELLCPNCHSLTPNYKALNIGNGRYKRMVRYKEGKSF